MLNTEIFSERLSAIVGSPIGKKFLLTVSGGADSCVLAYLFKECQLDFSVAHCNFHLRGKDSDWDMNFVKNIPYISDKEIFVKDFDTLEIQKESGKSIEMIARDLRYDWFRELAKNFDFVVTAHNANDNAETLLLHLCRGTGLRGLQGIPAKNMPFIRPLLSFSAKEIRDFAQEKGIDYRNDVTNFSTIYQRNKIRWDVMPHLCEINENVIDVFSRNMALFSQQYAIYEQEIEKQKSKVLTENRGEATISIPELKKVPDASLLLFEILSNFNFNKTTISDIANALDGETGRQFYSPTHKVLKDRDRFIIRPIAIQKEKFLLIHNESELNSAGFFISEHSDFENVLKEKDNKNVIFVDKSAFSYPLTLRTWKKGDAFFPFGMNKKRKLSDFFKDEKINRDEKMETQILCTNDKIMWIVGLRADNRFRIKDSKSQSFYKIEANNKKINL